MLTMLRGGKLFSDGLFYLYLKSFLLSRYLFAEMLQGSLVFRGCKALYYFAAALRGMLFLINHVRNFYTMD